jgi:hypothetical protein
MTTHTEAQLLRAFNAITLWAIDVLKRYSVICTAGLEFELGHIFLVRAWDSRGFTRSPGLTKNAFRRVRFPRIKKEEVMGY